MDSSTASEDFYREDGIMNKISVPRVRTHNQKETVAAMTIAEKKVCAHRS